MNWNSLNDAWKSFLIYIAIVAITIAAAVAMSYFLAPGV